MAPTNQPSTPLSGGAVRNATRACASEAPILRVTSLSLHLSAKKYNCQGLCQYFLAPLTPCGADTDFCELAISRWSSTRGAWFGGQHCGALHTQRRRLCKHLIPSNNVEWGRFKYHKAAILSDFLVEGSLLFLQRWYYLKGW